MGHFGRFPIRVAWFAIVLPALVLNYYGQGALLLKNPDAIQNPFYLLAPGWALAPMVVLAIAATVIAGSPVRRSDPACLGKAGRIPLIHQFLAGDVQALGHERRKPLQQRVAEIRFRFAPSPHGVAIEDQQGRGCFRSGLKTPFVRRYQPRPSQNLVGAEALHLQRRARNRRNLGGDAAVSDQIELVGALPLAEQDLAWLELLFAGAAGQEPDGFRA